MQRSQANSAARAGRDVAVGSRVMAQQEAEPKGPNFVLAGIFLSSPAMVVTFVVLLTTGTPLLQSLLTAYCLQVAVFALVLLLGVVRTQTPSDDSYTTRNEDELQVEPT